MRFLAMMVVVSLSSVFLVACGSDPNESTGPKKKATTSYSRTVDHAQQTADQLEQNLSDSTRRADDALKGSRRD